MSQNESDGGESKCRERAITRVKRGKGGGKGDFKGHFGGHCDIIKENSRDEMVKETLSFQT